MAPALKVRLWQKPIFASTVTFRAISTALIGESAVVRSDIIARDVILAGKVFGSITTEGRLTITPTGELYGNTATPTLIISEGGILNGTSQMNQTTMNQAIEAESPTATEKSDDENQSSFSQDEEDSEATLQPEAG